MRYTGEFKIKLPDINTITGIVNPPPPIRAIVAPIRGTVGTPDFPLGEGYGVFVLGEKEPDLPKNGRYKYCPLQVISSDDLGMEQEGSLVMSTHIVGRWGDPEPLREPHPLSLRSAIEVAQRMVRHDEGVLFHDPGPIVFRGIMDSS